MNIFSFWQKKKPKSFEQALENALKKTEEARLSLRDYDEGKKEISTEHIEKRFPNIKIK
ncbi:MAG: hypothetical protein KBB55_03005 [Candidatus Buchananbacteria bacterium]|nr:hypothetical protein [Candidatus Buchananbacteria bacterium]